MSKSTEEKQAAPKADPIRTCTAICQKCENYFDKVLDNHVVCLLNLENMDFEPKTEGNNLIVEIDADEKTGEADLTTVPGERCPFYLEQLLEANKLKEKEKA